METTCWDIHNRAKCIIAECTPSEYTTLTPLVVLNKNIPVYM